MLDPKLVKENPQAIKEMLKSRNMEFDLDGLIEADKNRREFILKTDELRKKRNQFALEISQKKKAGEDTSRILDEMKKGTEKENIFSNEERVILSNFINKILNELKSAPPK